MRSDLLRRYEEWLAAVPLANSTIATYVSRLKGILRLCEAQEWQPEDLTVLQARWLLAQFSPGFSSRAHIRSVLSHLWDMYGVEGPVEAITVPPPPPARYRGLEPDEATRLERAALEVGWPRGTVVLIGLYLGLRREKTVTLRWSNFDQKMEWVTISGKGNRTRHIPVARELRRELQDRRIGTGWLFPSDSNNRAYIHTGTVYNWVAQIAEKAGLGHVHPHGLRHTCLATMNDATRDLRTTQVFAGHSDIKSTEVYTRASKRNLVAAVESLSYRR